MNILIPRNIEGRDEKIKQKWYRLFTTQEVIQGDVIIKMNLDIDIDPLFVKTKKINGDVSLYNITKIPQFFENIEINGWFDCSYNKLTSLKGSPKIVHRSFYCQYNNLNSLEGCPKEVGGSFWRFNNAKRFTREEVAKYCNTKTTIMK